MKWFISISLSIFINLPNAHAQFYRTMYGPIPPLSELKYLETLFGANLIYVDSLNELRRVSGTVWHSDLGETQKILGDHNPALLSEPEMQLADQTEDKWIQHRLFSEAGANQPRTELLSDTLAHLGIPPRAVKTNTRQYLIQIQQKLREAFPNGFFIKPRIGFASQGAFPSEKTIFYSKWLGYRTSVKPREQWFQQNTHLTADEIHLELHEREAYIGKYIDELMNHPERYIIQEKIPIGERDRPVEIRVHVAEGEVLPEGAVDRWINWEELSRQDFEKAKQLVSETLKRLPSAYRKFSYAMDIIKGMDGKFYVIEANVGTNSGLLEADVDVLAAQSLSKRYGGSFPILKALEQVSRTGRIAAMVDGYRQILQLPEILWVEKETWYATLSLKRFMADRLLEGWQRATSRERKMIREFLRQIEAEHMLKEINPPKEKSIEDPSPGQPRSCQSYFRI